MELGQDFELFLEAAERGDFSTASKFASNLVSAHPANTHFLCNRALCFLKLEYYRKCIKDCDDALALDGKCAVAFVRKGQALLKMGKDADAKSTFEQGSKEALGDVDVMLSLRKGARGESLEPSAKESKSSPVAASDSSQRPISPVNGDRDAGASRTEYEEHLERGLRSGGNVEAFGSVSAEESFFGGSNGVSGGVVLDESLKEHIEALDVKQVEALAHVAAKGMVVGGVGNAAIDQRIAFGNLQVNTGKFDMGVKVFTELIKEHPDTVAAFLGRGTALAMKGSLLEASIDFSRALKLSPTNIDALKRRAQVLSALGRDQEALADLNTSVDLSKDADSYHQRGISYHKLHNYKRAVADFSTASKLDHANKATYNYLGLCHICLGDPKSAIENYKKALALDPKYKEALSNLGQAYKEWAKESEALNYFTQALAVDSTYAHGWYLRGLCYFGLGLHKHAYNDFTNALKCDQTLFEAWWMRGVSGAGLGLSAAATQDMDRALAIKPEHAVWYQRQLSLFYHHHMDTPLASYNIDAVLDPEFKEWWCKRNPPKSSLPKQPKVNPKITDVDVTSPAPAWLSNSVPVRALLDMAAEVGKWLHQDSPGFLKNRRQIAMAGFAAIEMAQMLRRIWGLASLSSSSSSASSSKATAATSGAKKSGQKGKNTPSAASSPAKKGSAATSSASPSLDSLGSAIPFIVDGKSSSGDSKPHEFGWRDLYDIVVKWRQFSEPNDPVWWVDKLTPSQFTEGFGSHTPIHTGQCRVIRYGRMWDRSIAIIKQLMEQQCVMTEEQKKALKNVDSPEALYAILKRDFFVVSPCHSMASPGKIMEGTRITIQASPPEGYEYSIRTPGTPPRWVDYDLEMAHAFSELTTLAKRFHGALSAGKPLEQGMQDELAKQVLTTAFYWYNFMPLARGTAICGYTSILAMFLAFGLQLQAPIPTNTLLDWDAILLPTPKEFIEMSGPWIFPHLKIADMAVFDALPQVRDVFPTLRHMLTVLNVVCKE